jgi:predicted ATP-binding protein involved in virulence
MRLHSLKIQNFRAIESLDDHVLDFTDSFSRPRKFTLIVGPNTSGKTSILDAIDVVIKTVENPLQPKLRDGLEFSSAQLVRGRGVQARIDLCYSVTDKEAEQINAVFGSLDIPLPFKNFGMSPCGKPATCTWTFPSRQSLNVKKYDLRCGIAATALGARGQLAIAIARKWVNYENYRQIGGVCYIDQRRAVKMEKAWQTTITESQSDSYDDVLSWLYNFRSKHDRWNEEKFGESSWSMMKRLFNEICSPSTLVDLEAGPDSETLILTKNGVEYELAQMSSGEHQILRILVAMIVGRAVNSIVLIDEVELHLHPAWQRKLLSVLKNDKTLNNQYIFTTHAPFVKDFFSNDEIIELGSLD